MVGHDRHPRARGRHHRVAPRRAAPRQRGPRVIAAASSRPSCSRSRSRSRSCRCGRSSATGSTGSTGRRWRSPSCSRSGRGSLYVRDAVQLARAPATSADGERMPDATTWRRALDAPASPRPPHSSQLLTDRGLTIAVAESLTGGLLAAALVDVPGASAVVSGGVVAYATPLKHSRARRRRRRCSRSAAPCIPTSAEQMADRRAHASARSTDDPPTSASRRPASPGPTRRTGGRPAPSSSASRRPAASARSRLDLAGDRRRRAARGRGGGDRRRRWPNSAARPTTWNNLREQPVTSVEFTRKPQCATLGLRARRVRVNWRSRFRLRRSRRQREGGSDGSGSTGDRRCAQGLPPAEGAHAPAGRVSKASVALGYLSEVERGQKEASSEILASVADALDTPISVIMREVGDRLAVLEGLGRRSRHPARRARRGVRRGHDGPLITHVMHERSAGLRTGRSHVRRDR